MSLRDIHFLTLGKLKEHLSNPPMPNPILIISKSGAARWGLDTVIANQGYLWIDQVDANPDINTVIRTLNAIPNPQQHGCIIAIGGGSTIDLSKAVSGMGNMKGIDTPDKIVSAIASGYYQTVARQHTLPIFAVPTTAGTGSEVTQWATIWDHEKKAKYSMDAPWLLPQEAWIVPELIDTLTVRQILSTGLDAVCHATEAYWARSANPLSRALSLKALEIMIPTLSKAVRAPQDKDCQQLCSGALTAGLAFSITRTTACHSISYPLTTLFGVEHGMAVAITLAQVAQRNQTVCDMEELLTLFAPYGGIQGWIDTVSSGITTLRLSTFGVLHVDIPCLADKAFTGGRMDNNPILFSSDEVADILQCVY